MSLEDKIERYLAQSYPAWESKGYLQTVEFRNDDTGGIYLPDSVGRKLRLAESNSKIAVKYEGKNTLYKWLPLNMREDYRTAEERKNYQPEVLFTSKL